MIEIADKRERRAWTTCCAVLAVLLLVLTAGGCSDPVARHKVLTDFFDGVPDLPSLDELCEDSMDDVFNDYYEARIAEASSGALEEKKIEVKKGSIHPPYAAQNCTGCHNFKKPNLLKTTKDKICFVCHKNFVTGSHVHGPVAVGGCLACHFPHSSENPSLLRRSLRTICFKCHKEKRLAEKMHEQVVSHNMLCVNCHNPHSGNVKYFLK